MKYTKLPHTDIKVSKICLGTMTWGEQNTQVEGHEQMDYALEQGVNFFDTAEMYSIPGKAETYGSTEKIIGSWFKNSGNREKIVLASKIAGLGLAHIRNTGFSKDAITEALHGSLKRLQTDYIDLYQLHWPNRQSPHFGNHWPNTISYSQVDSEQQNEEMLDILQGLAHCVNAGKIRYCGLSDDTPWGINQYLRLSAEHNLPRMVSIQNEFSLLHTKDWPYLIENCIHENIAYLPWSPLATGLLTGKYLNGQRPEGSRFTLMQRHGLFRDTQHTEAAVLAYVELAKKHNISPAHLALGWCNQVDGVTSTIIGATNMQQLKQNVSAFKQPLTPEVLDGINQVLRKFPKPF